MPRAARACPSIPPCVVAAQQPLSQQGRCAAARSPWPRRHDGRPQSTFKVLGRCLILTSVNAKASPCERARSMCAVGELRSRSRDPCANTLACDIFIVLFFNPRQYGHASGNAPPWSPATPSGAVNTCNQSHCATVTGPRRLARLRARVSIPFSQTVRLVFKRQLALPAALRQSCSEEFEHRPTG